MMYAFTYILQERESLLVANITCISSCVEMLSNQGLKIRDLDPGPLIRAQDDASEGVG